MISDAGSEVGQMVAKTFAKYSANLSLCGSVGDSFVLNGLASECSSTGLTRVKISSFIITDYRVCGYTDAYIKPFKFIRKIMNLHVHKTLNFDLAPKRYEKFRYYGLHLVAYK